MGVTYLTIHGTLAYSNAHLGHHIAAARTLLSTVFTARWLAEAAQKECFSLLTYQDKTLTCVDCGMEFSFTASDQQFYADRQFSEPRRCPACRAAKKAARGESTGGYSSGGGGGYGGGGYSDRPREMFSATCDSCGKEARVPFRPTGTKPVYCSDCFRR
jgi:CxxC-x17-CxxC domain-containing protein